MQKTKALRIQHRQITIKELKVKDIYELLATADGAQEVFLDQVQSLFQRTTGLTSNDLIELYPSEIEELWKAILEVNDSFLSLAGKIGLDHAIREILQDLRTDWSKQYTVLSVAATAREPGTTGMISS